MSMTHDEMIAIIQAHKEGKRIECKFINFPDEWEFVDTPKWNFESCNYRIAPTPKLRPWRPEEVPVGAQLRCITDHTIRYMITGCSSSYVWITMDCKPHYKNMLDTYEHSLDNGRTWLPCGVMEEQ